MFETTIANLNLHNGTAPFRPTGSASDSVQRIELTLKKISSQSDGTLQCVPLSSACTSGCFSSVSSISVDEKKLNSVDDAQIEQVMRLHDKALSVMGQDDLVWSAIAKGIELGLTK